MGFFDKIKSAVGIGQPKLTLNITENNIKRGTILSGSISIVGKSKDTPIKEFEVRLEELRKHREWSSATKSYVERTKTTVVGKKVIPKDGYSLKADETLEENFELEVSTGLLPSGHPYSYRLVAQADIPGLDSKAKQEVFII